MKSVRITVTGVVVLACLTCLTAPVRACDDRFFQRCEAEATPPPEADAPAVTTRRKPARLRAAVPRADRPERQARRTRAPRFATHYTPAAATPDPALILASDEQPVAPAPESALARRFHGFIDPQSMTVNSFEELRRPRLDAQHLTPAPTLPANDAAASAEDVAPPEANVIVDPPTVLAAVPAQAALPVVMPPVEVRMISEAPPATQPVGGFPVHQLVLALCGALGVASALRFIVGT